MVLVDRRKKFTKDGTPKTQQQERPSRTFKLKRFSKKAAVENITDAEMLKTVERLKSGLFHASYGSGVYKCKIAPKGRGTQEARSIIAYKQGKHVFLMYLFVKADQDNIDEKEEKALKKEAKKYFAFTEADIEIAINKHIFLEVKDGK